MTLEFFDLAFAITLLWTMLSPLSFTLSLTQPSPSHPPVITRPDEAVKQVAQEFKMT